MKKPLTTLALALFACNSQAASDSDQIMQRQQQFERDQIHQKEIKQVEKELERIEQIENEEQQNLTKESGKVVQDLRAIQCFRIREIKFSSNQIISKFRSKILTKDYLGKCLNLSQISELNQKISNYLAESGYATSRSNIPQQSIESGILKIEITESGLEKIIFREDNFFDQTQKFTAFGLVGKDEILDMKKIEQGLEQINRLSSNNATIKILPSSQENTSIIAVENNPKNSSRLSAAYDNNGVKLTGARRETISFNQDNLLRLNDNLVISRTANDLDNNRKEQGSNSFSSSFSVPFTWCNLTLNYSKSSYFFHSGDIVNSKYTGTTSTKSAAFDALLLKSKKFKLATNLLLTQRYNQNFSAGVKDSSSHKASFGSVSLPTTLFFNESSLFLKPTYSKSLNILDSQTDGGKLPSNVAHFEFDIFRFYANFSQKLKIVEAPISYNLTFDSQISKQTLYGVDQFAVGGVYSVRGFANGSIADDSGYNVKNEISVNLGRGFALTPFYDYGYVRSKGGQQSGRLSGTGFKIGFSQQYFSANIIFSWAISKSQYLLQNYGENNAVYFNLASEFGFF